MKIKKRQAGFGLLELMLSMVIVALLLIMATRYYQSARSNARINQAVSLTGTIVSAANTISLGTGGYAGVTTAQIYPYLPASAHTAGDGKTINSPWQSAVTIADGATKDKFEIDFAGLPAMDCAKLADALGGSTNVDTTMSATCTDGQVAVTVNYNNSNK